MDAVLKELLHCEILQAMLEAGALETLTFQGGTALRLCYKGERYSEDLDFVCGPQFDPSVLDSLTEVLTRRIGRFYGLDVELGMRTPSNGDRAGKWRAKVKIPAPDRSGRAAFAINIEVAAVPAYTRELLRIKPSFSELPASYNALLVPTESLEEIAADKVVAFGARSHLKHRDVWDLWSLNTRGVAAPAELVRNKLADCGLDEGQLVASARAWLPEILDPGYHSIFLGEIERFTDHPTFAMLVRDEMASSMLSGAAALVASAISAVGEPQ